MSKISNWLIGGGALLIVTGTFGAGVWTQHVEEGLTPPLTTEAHAAAFAGKDIAERTAESVEAARDLLAYLCQIDREEKKPETTECKRLRMLEEREKARKDK